MHIKVNFKDNSFAIFPIDRIMIMCNNSDKDAIEYWVSCDLLPSKMGVDITKEEFERIESILATL